MGSLSLTNCCLLARLPGLKSSLDPRLRCQNLSFPVPRRYLLSRSSGRWRSALSPSESLVSDSVPSENGAYKVGDFMTKKHDLHVVKQTTTVDEALEALVEKRITGFPVIDDDWNLVGVVSDYDLLALDSISACVPFSKNLTIFDIDKGMASGSQNDTNMFPDVNSSWKTFNKIQKLLSKTHGKVVGDLMTSTPLVVHDTSNLEDAARLLLETKYRRLPVIDDNGKLVGIITRGNVVRAALQIKRATESST